MRQHAHWMACCLLAACSAPDYSAIRDWGRTASLATTYWPAAEPIGTPAAEAGDDTAAALTGASSIGVQPDLSIREDILLMQQVLSVYLAALATVASDGVLPYREDPFALISAQLATTNRTAGQAAAAIGSLLRRASRTNMQAPATGSFIIEADPAVQFLIAELATTVASLSKAEAGQRDRITASYAQLEGEAPSAFRRQALRDLAAIRIQHYSTRADARANYLVLLERLSEGHALLRIRSSHLSQEEVRRQVRAAEDQLRGAFDLLPRIPIPISDAVQPVTLEDTADPSRPPP